MRALSVKQPWANLIASGRKTIECRTWATTYRGPIIIVSSKRPDIEPAGCTVALATLDDCTPLTEVDFPDAFPTYNRSEFEHDWSGGIIGWRFSDIKQLHPFPMKGQQGLYYVAYRCSKCLKEAYQGKRIGWYEGLDKKENAGLVLVHEKCWSPCLPYNPGIWSPFTEFVDDMDLQIKYRRLHGFA